MKTRKLLFIALCLFLTPYFVFASEATIQAEISGKGRPIIFLPGFGCPGEVWNETIAIFQENFECHAISYPGFNGIAAPDTLWYETVLNQLKDYINNELDEKPLVVGHSLGGTFALDLESRESTFSKIILVDVLPSIASVMMPNVPIENLRYDSPYNNQLLAMDAVQFETMQSHMAAGMCKNTEKQATIKEWMLRADRKTYVHGYTDLLKTDLRKDLANIQIPALVLSAIHFNAEQTRNNIENQYAELSDKKVAYIEDSGHFIMFDQLDWLIAQIKKFI